MRTPFCHDEEVVHPHTRANRISLALHQVVAQRVREQPELVGEAQERLRRWAAAGTMHRVYVNRWEQLLAGPWIAIEKVLTQDDESQRELRQNSPFAGVLSARERWAVIAVVDQGENP